MNTPIDKTKSDVIIALDIFKEVNRFKEQVEADEAGQEEDRYKHSVDIFVFLMK